MSFSNFTELTEEVIDFIQRPDLDIKIPSFITLAEQEMFNNPTEPLKIKFLEKTSTASTTITSRFIALPDDYKSMRSIRFDIENESDFLTYRTPQQLNRFDVSGRPCFFTIIGTQIEFDRIPDEVLTVEIQYNAKGLGLTAAAPTNTLLTNHPEVYLYGTVYRALKYARDAESAATYKEDFIGAIIGANKADKQGQYGPAPTMKVEGSTP